MSSVAAPAVGTTKTSIFSGPHTFKQGIALGGIVGVVVTLGSVVAGLFYAKKRCRYCHVPTGSTAAAPPGS